MTPQGCCGDRRADAMDGQGLPRRRDAWQYGANAPGQTRVRVPDDLRPPRPPDGRPDHSALVSVLMAHIETLKAGNEQLEARLLDAEAQADRAIAELSAMARRLAEIAERQGRPWWRRLRLILI